MTALDTDFTNALNIDERGDRHMTWFRVDDSFRSHPKTRSIPRRARMAAIGVWTVCGNWAAQHLTDGLVPADAVEDEGGTQADAKRLVAARLWHVTDHDCDRCPDPGPDAYQFHDWPEYQRMRVDVLAEREAAAERMRKARAKRRPPPDDDEGSSGERSPQHPPNVPANAKDDPDTEVGLGMVTADEKLGRGKVTKKRDAPGTDPANGGLNSENTEALRPNFARSSPNPDPTRPDPLSTSSGHLPSSSDLSEREDDDGPTTDELIERGAGRLTPSALAVEADAFRAINAGHWPGIHDWRRAWSAWLTKAPERNRPTPTPGTPSCPLHPDQPTGSKACPKCAAEAAPAPDLRALRKEAS